MRIYGNRLLKTLPGQQTRPTSARVREALFNIWQTQLEGARYLDLCAGNGTMGAEALCRNISVLVGIEQNRRACQIIKENWEKVAASEQKWQIMKGNLPEKIKDLQGQEFDLIYFDPPYGSELYNPVLNEILNLNLLAKEGEIAIEHDPKQWQYQEIKGLTVIREKKYGNTTLTFLEKIN
ncbi:MAG: 16S rRNA (guanine(966)-N(2))-methyltransferase RsmD [Halothece sp. Uz-M2-17]|nr:16S rRNA (guanine(966)-N(2))-methyltransferase RsmD [Halothece sp. Uz-M2-17]